MKYKHSRTRLFLLQGLFSLICFLGSLLTMPTPLHLSIGNLWLRLVFSVLVGSLFAFIFDEVN